MFAAQSFWRDLVSFTWNLTTVEHPEGVRDLLTATLERTAPSGFATSEPPTEDGGVVTAWFTFETAVGRGTGLLRLKEEDGADRAWTFLTTLDELKGHEEPQAHPAAARAPSTAPTRTARRGRSAARPRPRAWARRPSRTCSSSAAARAASPSVRGCASSGCRAWSSTSTRARATSGATATSRSACTTRSGTTTCRT